MSFPRVLLGRRRLWLQCQNVTCPAIVQILSFGLDFCCESLGVSVQCVFRLRNQIKERGHEEAMP